MKFTEQKPDYFDQHRKDHSGRAMMLTFALATSALLWVAIIAAVVTLL